MVNDACYLDCLEPPQSEAAGQACEGEAKPPFDKRAVDKRLALAARKSLEASGYPQVACVTVLVHNAVVVLRGTVSRYYFRQLAQAAVLRLTEVERVCDEIVVIPQSI